MRAIVVSVVIRIKFVDSELFWFLLCGHVVPPPLLIDWEAPREDVGDLLLTDLRTGWALRNVWVGDGLLIIECQLVLRNLFDCS
jgi:hypothetical protein